MKIPIPIRKAALAALHQRTSERDAFSAPYHTRCMIERGWQREFDEPIMLPNGRTLTTLEDERGGPTMFARNGFKRALNARP
jgi:hypothetical protein